VEKNSASDWCMVIWILTPSNGRQKSIRMLYTSNTRRHRDVINHDLFFVVFEFAMVGMKGTTGP
jgi:hypothetical protein